MKNRSRITDYGLPSIFLFLILAITACSPSPAQLNEDGNEAFANQDYVAALDSYQQALVEDETLAEPYYNAANTLYRQELYPDAQAQMEQALAYAQGNLAEEGYYNVGNSFYNQQQLEAAIEAYKEALRLNPNDIDAKHNLELALQQQQQEQQQQDQNQEQQDQNQDQQDQNQDQQDQNQDQQDQNQEQQDQNQEQQDQKQDQQQDDQQEQNQQPQPGQGQPQRLTPEQAQQLLAAIAQETDTLQERLQEMFVVPLPPPAEDW
ncbi:MAG: tetratricopeptide repeat protein [Anaerolineales bacterium]|nr:tetratricopeptide repeat protein [Anaerolineales bacterium]